MGGFKKKQDSKGGFKKETTTSLTPPRLPGRPSLRPGRTTRRVGCHTDHCAPAKDFTWITTPSRDAMHKLLSFVIDKITWPAFVAHIGAGQAAGGSHQPPLATRPNLKEVGVEGREEEDVEVKFQPLVLFCPRAEQGEVERGLSMRSSQDSGWTLDLISPPQLQEPDCPSLKPLCPLILTLMLILMLMRHFLQTRHLSNLVWAASSLLLSEEISLAYMSMSFLCRKGNWTFTLYTLTNATSRVYFALHGGLLCAAITLDGSSTFTKSTGSEIDSHTCAEDHVMWRHGQNPWKLL